MIDRRGLLTGSIPLVFPRMSFARSGGELRVQGNLLIDDGQIVRLRGVVVGDLLKPGRPYLYPYATIKKSWKANAVRISVHPGYWLADNRGSRERLLRNIAAARAAHLYVVLCWHAIGFPGRYTRVPPPEYNSRKDAFSAELGAMKAFWGEMAARYSDDSRVMFELFNEPILNIDRLDKDYLNWNDLRDIYEEIIKLDIRTKSNNVVICGGNRFAYDLRGASSNPVRCGNVAYAWHVYPGRGGGSEDDWINRLGKLHLRHPVVVTEWGFISTGVSHLRGTIEGFGKPLLNFLNKNDLSWFAYSFSGYSQPALLSKDWNTKTDYGRYIYSELNR